MRYLWRLKDGIIKEPYYGGYEKKSQRREDPLSKLEQKKRNATTRRMLEIKELIEMQRFRFVAPRDGGRQAGSGQVSSPIDQLRMRASFMATHRTNYGSCGTLPCYLITTV